MNIFGNLPEWLATALVAAIFAILGFFGRKAYDRFEELRTKKANVLRQIEKLKRLLEESKSIFDSQDYLVRKLSSLLRTEFGDEVIQGEGYDDMFFRMYDMMTDEQRELFDLIRGSTMNSMRRVNEELLQWTKENSVIESIEGKSSRIGYLNTQVIQLKQHLNLWFDKYEAIFKVNERRSLIYLADEKEQGKRFPSELKNAVDNIIVYLHPLLQRSNVKKNKKKQELILENFKKEFEAVISQIDVLPKSKKSEFDIALDGVIEQIVQSVDIKNSELEGHTKRVTEMAIRIANSMGINGDELAQMRRGALLHDIGKIGVPQEILQKKGALTDEEAAIMYQHPIYAYEILHSLRYLISVLDIPYCHHEKWDGTGYPRGLKGMEIPLAARIFAIADVWEALYADRPYRRGLPEDQIREFISKESGKSFDPKIVGLFLKILRSRKYSSKQNQLSLREKRKTNPCKSVKSMSKK